MKRKIHFVTPSLAAGGAERVMVWIANNLISDFQIIFLVFYKTRNSFIGELDTRIKVKFLETKSVTTSFLELKNYVKLNKEDYFFSAQMHVNIVLLTLKIVFFRKLKLIIREANSLKLNNLPTFKDKLLFLLSIFMYRKSNFVVSLDANTKNILQNVFSVSEGKIRVLENPVDSNIIDKLSVLQIENLPFDDYFIAIGRLEHQKNYEFLIKLFKTNNLNLIIVGEGSQFKKLNDMIINYNISNRVKLIGHQKNIFNYLARSKALLLSSHYEGFPNVVVQSLYLGVPVFVNDKINVAVDLVNLTKLGFALNIQESTEWNTRLENCYFDQTTINNSKQICLELFGSQNISKKYSKMFNELS